MSKDQNQAKKLFVAPVIKAKRKLYNWEVMQLYKDLNELKTVNGIKLNYAIHRTKASLKPLAEAYERDKLIPVLDQYKEYDKALADAYKDLTKDKAGNPQTRINTGPRGEQYEVPDVDLNSPEAIKVRAQLQAKFADAIADRQQQIKEYNEWLVQECSDDYTLFIISKSDIPDSNENNKQLWDTIAPMIKPMSEELEKEWNELFSKI